MIYIRNGRGSEAQREKCVTRVSKIAGQLREGRDSYPSSPTNAILDHEVALELVARLAKDSSFLRDPVRVNQCNYESFYGNAVCVLSNRLHAALTTLVLGGCGIALVDPRYDVKIINAFIEVNLQNFIIETRDYMADGIESRQNNRRFLSGSRFHLLKR